MSNPSSKPTIAVIGGDGIGPEVVAEGLKVLDVVAPDTFEFVHYDLGAERYLRTGEVLPESVTDELAKPTRSCSVPSAPPPARPRSPPVCSSAACCSSCASCSTTASTCARRGSNRTTY